MGEIYLTVLIVLCIAIGVMFLSMNVAYWLKGELVPMTLAEEDKANVVSAYAITAENVDTILEWQMAKAVENDRDDHPAFIAAHMLNKAIESAKAETSDV